MQKSAKFQNNGKIDPPSGICAPPGGTIFLSEILTCLSMVEKTKWFLMGKNSTFINNKVENFKNLEILQSKRFFEFSSGNNFWYIHAS